MTGPKMGYTPGMCGRYTFSASPAELDRLGVDPADLRGLQPRYNVAPSQGVPVLGLKADGRRRGLARLRWGLVPGWSSDPSASPKPINAKAETVATLPTFRDSFRSRRCLLPADGFYEWAKLGPNKVPHLFRTHDGLFAFAGLWASWGSGADRLLTCCLITTPANDLVRPVHARMPAILSPDVWDAWLSPSTPAAELLGLLQPFPSERMTAVAVGPAVNSARTDGPECVLPA